MAEPNPAAVPVKNPFKGLPTPVKLAAVGGALGIGYSLYRSKNSKDVAVSDQGSTVDTSATDTSSGDYSYADVPVGSPPVQVPVAGPDSGETVGAVGQTGLETLGTLFGGALSTVGDIATTAIGSRPEPYSPDWAGLAALFSAAQPPKQPTPGTRSTGTKPNNQSVTILNRKFAGAIGYRELAPTKLVRKFLITFKNGHHESWYYYKEKSGSHKAGDWRKVGG